MDRNLERFHQLLAGRGMAVGDHVVCDYRIPTSHQWWVAPFWVGIIQQPSTNVVDWNGHNSEAYHCANFLYVPIRYLGVQGGMPGFTQRDQLSSLRPVMWGSQIQHSPWYGSGERSAGELYHFACRCGLGDRYAEHKRAAEHSRDIVPVDFNVVEIGAQLRLVG